MRFDFKVAEKLADEIFHSIPAPHLIKDVALWHIFTVVEDTSRMLFTKWIEKEGGFIENFMDECKYALRHCLDRIENFNLIDERVPVPTKTDAGAYIRANSLFVGADQYAKFSRIAGSIHSSRAHLVCIDDRYSIKYVQPFDPRYAALELLHHGSEAVFDITTLLYEAFSNTRKYTAAELAIGASARLKNRRIHYKYDFRLAYSLAQEVPQRPVLFPSNFEFPWGNSKEALILINALHVRCLYHLFAVNLTAARYHLRGGAEHSLVLVLKESELIRDLCYLADVGEEKIKSFIYHLTYGYESKTPDPALQPLIRTKSGVFLLPCFHIITSNSQRNLLSLMARICKNEFNKQTSNFEKSMTDEMLTAMKNWVFKFANREFSIEGAKEELDLLVVDFQTNSLLTMELRWMLQPGDPREVENRFSVCEEKVEQLSRKISFVKRYANEVVKRCCPGKNLDPEIKWNVFGITVIDGFGGRVSPLPKIPVVTLDIMKTAMYHFSSVVELYEWAASLAWLPQVGTHYEINSETMQIGSKAIDRPCILLKANKDKYLKHVKRTISSK